MTELLKYTLINTLEFFKCKVKNYYNFSFLFLLIFSLIGFVASLLIYYSIDNIYNLQNENFSFIQIFLTNNGTNFLQVYSIGFTIIILGLYSAYIYSIKSTDHTPTIKKFFGFIKTKDWNNFSIILITYSLLSIFLYGGIFKTTIEGPEEGGIISFLNLFEIKNFNSSQYLLCVWFDNITSLILLFSPYIGAVFIIDSNISNNSFKLFIKKYKKASFVLIIVSFCLEAIIINTIEYVDFYLIGLKKIVIQEEISSVIFENIINILIYSYFLLLVSGILLFTTTFISNEDSIDKNSI